MYLKQLITCAVYGVILVAVPHLSCLLSLIMFLVSTPWHVTPGPLL